MRRAKPHGAKLRREPMARPPNPGDANNPNDDDPLGGIDPMAWLESLAARQGANPDELTTAADLDIPLPPEGTKETGPGYTPGYDVGKSGQAAPTPPPAPTPTPDTAPPTTDAVLVTPTPPPSLSP